MKWAMPGSAGRRTFRMGVQLSILCLAPWGCSDDEESEVDDVPPQLSILGARNEAAATFDRDSEILEIACGSRLTLRLGPASDNAGVLDNWTLRGPGACDEREQCGFVEVRVLGADGAQLLSTTQAVTNPVIDLGGIEVARIRGFEALLIEGSSGEPFLVDEVEVRDEWSVPVRLVACDMANMGGSGGSLGIGGTSPGGASPGGASPGGAGGFSATDE